MRDIHSYFSHAFNSIALLTNVVTLVLNQLKNVPPTYHGMFTISALALINILACVVYRKIKFGLITEDGTTFTTTNAHAPWATGLGVTHALPLVQLRRQLFTDETEGVSNTDASMPMEVTIMNESEQFKDDKSPGVHVSVNEYERLYSILI